MGVLILVVVLVLVVVVYINILPPTSPSSKNAPKEHLAESTPTTDYPQLPPNVKDRPTDGLASPATATATAAQIPAARIPS
jgi:hypothetical protein